VGPCLGVAPFWVLRQGQPWGSWGPSRDGALISHESIYPWNCADKDQAKQRSLAGLRLHMPPTQAPTPRGLRRSCQPQVEAGCGPLGGRLLDQIAVRYYIAGHVEG